MKRLLTSGLVVLVLTGCATGSVSSSDPYQVTAEEPARGVRTGRTFLSVVGTPFFLVFKTAVCAASVVIAPPAAALIALSDEPDKEAIRRELDAGVAKNCGPPYILSVREAD